MILNRIKEGVHGFAGDGLLAKNIRGKVFIDMQNADHILTRDEVMVPFKVLFNPGDSTKKLIFPAEYDNVAPADQYIAVYSATDGIIIRADSSGDEEYLFGASHIEYYPGVAVVIAKTFYSRYMEKQHEGLNSFAGNLVATVQDTGMPVVYEGSGGHSFTIDGALPWQARSQIFLSNVSDYPLGISAINSAVIYGVTTLAARSSVRLLRQAATLNWYSV